MEGVNEKQDKGIQVQHIKGMISSGAISLYMVYSIAVAEAAEFSSQT